MVRITIPCIPPTVNHYWGYRALGRGKIRKYLTTKAKAFKNIVKKCYSGDIFKKSPDKYLCVWVFLYYGDKRKRDIDNNLKAVFDSFNNVVWEDDSQVDYLIVERKISNMKFPYTKVYVEERDKQL